MQKNILRLAAALLAVMAWSGCAWVHDDISRCPKGFNVMLRQKLLSSSGEHAVGILADEVNDATLFVFDADDSLFVSKVTATGDELRENGYKVHVPTDPGRYIIIGWAGLSDSSYILPETVAGSTHLKDFTLLLDRDEEGRQNEYLTPLFHGMTEVVIVKEHQCRTVFMDMTKNTKNFVIVLQDYGGQSIKAETFTYKIISDNGKIDHANNIITDNPVSYGAYFIETVALDSKADDDAVMSITAARAEMNTLRFTKDCSTRFVLNERAGGKKVVDIDLSGYILLTKEHYENKIGKNLSDQEYLDSEHVFSIVFFMMPTGSIVNPYTVVSLKINDWIIRLNDAVL